MATEPVNDDYSSLDHSTLVPEPEASYSNDVQTGRGFSSLAPGKVFNTFLHRLEDHEIEQVEYLKYKQDLDRKLTSTSVIGLGFTLMGVPFGVSSTLWIALVDGGNVTLLYGWVIVAFFSMCVVTSLSEIISKYPTAGGVYHFSSILSNEKYSSISSWFTGWLLLIGNWTYATSVMYSGSQFILSMFGLKGVYYTHDIFLVLLVYVIILIFSGFINFKFSKHLERINRACIYWSIYTVLAIDFLLIFFAKRTNSIKDILTDFDNSRSGWPDLMAFMIGLQSASFTLCGYGLLFSLTDEVKNPEKNMPKGSMSAVFLSSIIGLIFILPILTILPELTLLLDKTPELMPIDLIFKISTESYIVSFLLVLLLIITVLFQSIGSLTAACRTTYVFARDGGLPFKNYWVEVDSVEEYKIPKNALFLSMAVALVLSLITLFSESAFNAFLGASVVSLSLANGIPILCLMLNKRRKIKGAAFRLRKAGWVINFLSVVWVLFLSMMLFLPPVIKNLTFFTMNYASVIVAIFVGFASIGYRTWGFKSFQGPEIDTDYFELHNISGTSNVESVGIDDAFIIGVDDIDDDDIASHQATASSSSRNGESSVPQVYNTGSSQDELSTDTDSDGSLKGVIDHKLEPH